MLSIAMMLFCMRSVVDDEYWGKLTGFRHAFWAMNIGLAGMAILVIAPIGYIQLQVAVESGFWACRTREFYQTPTVHALLWFRMLPDLIFVYGAARLALFMLGGLDRFRPEGKGCDPVQESIPASFVPQD